MDTMTILSALNMLERDALLVERVHTVLRDAEQEPLIQQLFQTPQSPEYHAEGPIVKHHVRQMLLSLFGLLEGKFSLLKMEEFAGRKELRDDVVEMEQVIKENAATFEVFAILHDVGKPFRLQKGSDGLYHYHGHEKEIFRPEVQELLHRLADQYRLTAHDRAMLTEMISLHMEPLRRFSNAHEPKDIDVLTRHITKRALDADDFLDLLQGGVLLDQVLGSFQHVGEKRVVQTDQLINFFIAEHAYAPWKREQRAQKHQAVQRQMEQAIFHEVGLDGDAMMKLTGMKPGKPLGALLQSLQRAAKGIEETPELPEGFQNEIRSRLQMAHDRIEAMNNV